MKKFDFKKYVEFKVYSVTTIKKGYGFRVLLKFADGSDITQQHAGFTAFSHGPFLLFFIIAQNQNEMVDFLIAFAKETDIL